ncbi:MAG: glycosyltransferase [Deltaproteobacteria bacterium]|jgi:glycosyltransferase involved in cell wall biosynthesis
MINPKKTRVAVVVSHLTIGGAEQLLLELLRHIDRLRFDLHIFFLREPGILGKEILQLGFPVSTGIIRSKFDLSGIFKLTRLLKDFQTDVVFLINHLNTLFFGVLASKLAGVRTCINWENETFKKYPFHPLTMLGRRILHLGVDYVVAAAKGHGDYIAVEEKIPYSKIRAIYNGVDPERFQSHLGKEEARGRLRISAQSPVVSIVAALRPDKAHHIFLRAARMVVDAIPEAHFLVIGDGPLMPFLKSLATDLNLEHQVRFLGFQRQLGDIFAAVDINCLSSYPQQETLSVAVIEAMSAGIPIVCTDVGFMNEIVIPNETGFLVPVDDPESLAKKIIHVLKNPEQQQYMGHQARKLVDGTLSVHQMARAFEQLMLLSKSG